MPRLVRTPQAVQDLLDLWLYIAADDVATADKFLDKIEGKCHMLAANPRIGRARPELSAGLHSFPVGNYVLFYRQIEDGIDLIRVLNGVRDLESLGWG